MATLECRLVVLERNWGVEGDVGAPTMDVEIVSEAKEKEDPIVGPPLVQPIKLFQHKEDVEHSTSLDTHPKSHFSDHISYLGFLLFFVTHA